MLIPVMRGGRRIAPAATLADVRNRAASGLTCLPESLRQLQEGYAYRVDIADALHELAGQVNHASHL